MPDTQSPSKVVREEFRDVILSNSEIRICQYLAKTLEESPLGVYGELAAAKAFEVYPHVLGVGESSALHIPSGGTTLPTRVYTEADPNAALTVRSPEKGHIHLLVIQRGPNRFRIVGYARTADLDYEHLQSQDPDTYVLPQEKLRRFTSWSS